MAALSLAVGTEDAVSDALTDGDAAVLLFADAGESRAWSFAGPASRPVEEGELRMLPSVDAFGCGLGLGLGLRSGSGSGSGSGQD